MARCTRQLSTSFFVLGLVASTASADVPRFTRGPSAAQVGGQVRIDFAVNMNTDVAVFIETSDGRIVRHLVAGVLGENAPPPLRPCSLSQSIPWGGKADDGKPAGDGPFRVRVALGLGAELDREAIHERQNFSGSKGGVFALATAEDGTLYVTSGFGVHVPNWRGWQMVALANDGRYRRTILPPPASTSAEQWKLLGGGSVQVDGQTVPLLTSLAERRLFAAAVGRKTAMTVAPTGEILLLCGPRIATIDPDGRPAWGEFVGPPLLAGVERPGLGPHASIAVSSDGKCAYVTGLRDDRSGKDVSGFAAVYRVPLPRRAPASPWFGEPEQPGNNETHLGDDPHGLAADGQGHLFVADHANDRIVVVEEDSGKYAAEIAVDNPHHLAVVKDTGALYVSRSLGDGRVEVIKYGSWQDPQPLVRTTLERDGNPDFPWSMAVDTSQRPPVVWMGSDAGRLLRLAEKEGKLVAKQVSSNRMGHAGFGDVQVDRFRESPDVYVRAEQGSWLRYNEDSGDVAHIRLQLPSAAGTCIVPGPDGKVYAPAYPYHLLRFDRDGNPAPWPGGANRYPESIVNWRGKVDRPTGPAHGTFLPVSMTYMTHTFGIRHDGRLFALDPGKPRTRPPKMLIEYDRLGRRTGDPIIWKVSDTAVGPRFDAAGNIYIAEQIRPLDRPVPPEFAALIGPVKPGTTVSPGVKAAVCTAYGSILKFSSKGGMVHWDGTDPFDGQPRLDPSLKTVDALYFRASGDGGRFGSVQVTGAEWIHMGIGHVALHYCNCETTRFDVDPFGRVFYPDLCRFRVDVIDTAGNEITHFGRYGNAEDAEISLAWLIGVGVTDKYAYLGDSMNRRLLRVKLVYAEEKSCDIEWVSAKRDL